MRAVNLLPSDRPQETRSGGGGGSFTTTRVAIVGGSLAAIVCGFVAEVERLTRVRVRPADPLGRVEVANGVGDRADLASLAIAIGLGVED